MSKLKRGRNNRGKFSKRKKKKIDETKSALVDEDSKINMNNSKKVEIEEVEKVEEPEESEVSKEDEESEEDEEESEEDEEIEESGEDDEEEPKKNLLKGKEKKEEKDSLKKVSEFRVSKVTQQLLKEKKNIETLFPIQSATFDIIYNGEDILARARTGTGKTLAFSLPVIEKLLKGIKEGKIKNRLNPKVIIISPTRELAVQTSKYFTELAPSLNTTLIYGGVPYGRQEGKLRKGTDVIVGTPGRILDLIGKGTLKLSEVKYIILDEADEMLNFGFSEPIEEILGSIDSEEKQHLFFSATIPKWVDEIAKKHLKVGYKKIDLVKNEKIKTPKLIKHLSIQSSYSNKQNILGDIVKVYGGVGKTIVFTETKKEANQIALNSSISKECQVLHGDISQIQREITLQSFKEGGFNVLVATNVASRGLDIPECQLIVQCNPPSNVDDYIHRSGRTARAGKKGAVVTFYTRSEKYLITKIERKVGVKFQKIGCPQPEQLIKSAADNVSALLESVSDKMIPYFSKTAKEIIKKYESPEKALSLALSKLCGYTEPFSDRSLLSSKANYLTVQLDSSREFYSKQYVLRTLEPFLPSGGLTKVGDIRFFNGGAVADLPARMARKLIKNAKHDNIKFKLCEQLPEIEESNFDRFGGKRNNRFGGKRNNRFGGDRRGRFGGRRNNRFGNGNRFGGNRNNNGGRFGGNRNNNGNRFNGNNNGNRFGRNNNGNRNGNRFGGNNNGNRNGNRFGNNNGNRNGSRFGGNRNNGKFGGKK